MEFFLPQEFDSLAIHVAPFDLKPLTYERYLAR